MQRYEYKVLPAPRRGTKARDAKTTEDRFALTLSTLMNDLGRDGWEYQRSETLPCDERSGFTKTKTTEQTMLIFRRELNAVAGLTPGSDTVSLLRPLAAEAAAPRLGPATDAPAGPSPALGRAE
ncbi:MAG: DUF4177 domain-containing protein [Rhodobacter sp.]|nr:DUF4177 domain-containing protein [Rhodobacter sp.]